MIAWRVGGPIRAERPNGPSNWHEPAGCSARARAGRRAAASSPVRASTGGRTAHEDLCKSDLDSHPWKEATLNYLLLAACLAVPAATPSEAAVLPAVPPRTVVF